MQKALTLMFALHFKHVHQSKQITGKPFFGVR
jgi:hypothetical protein